MRTVETGRAAKVAMFRETRSLARSRGDRTMVRNMDVELARLGFGELETTEALPMETTVPAPPRRGRRPLPRCEHNMIASRCPDCNEELVTIGAPHGDDPASRNHADGA